MELLSVDLQYFRETAAAGSVNAAARRLHVAGSAVSRQIVKLERTLGVTLFVRHGRGMELTAHGHRLLASVRRADVESAQLLSDLERPSSAVRRVRVACSDGFAGSLIGDVASSIARSRPEVRVDVTVCSSAEAVRLVRDARCELGACFVTEIPAGVRVEFSQQMPMSAVMARDHVLASRPELRLDEALEHPYGLLSGQSSQRDLIAAGASQRGRDLDPILEADRSEVLHDFARTGGGIVFRSMLTRDVLDDPRLTAVPISDPEMRQRSAQIHTPLPGDLDTVRSELIELLISRITRENAGRESASEPHQPSH